jgi:hypothetical protein
MSSKEPWRSAGRSSRIAPTTKTGEEDNRGREVNRRPVGGELVAVEATNEGKGQGVVVARGLARGAGRRTLTALEFQGLAAVPHEAEWFANIDNPRTRRAYRIDIHEFMGFVGIERPEERHGCQRCNPWPRG